MEPISMNSEDIGATQVCCSTSLLYAHSRDDADNQAISMTTLPMACPLVRRAYVTHISCQGQGLLFIFPQAVGPMPQPARKQVQNVASERLVLAERSLPKQGVSGQLNVRSW